MRLHGGFPFNKAQICGVREDRNSKCASEGMQGKVRVFRGEIDNYGRGRLGGDPFGCKSEQSAAPTDEANNRY
jgi:hypothetical protein